MTKISNICEYLPKESQDICQDKAPKIETCMDKYFPGSLTDESLAQTANGKRPMLFGEVRACYSEVLGNEGAVIQYMRNSELSQAIAEARNISDEQSRIATLAGLAAEAEDIKLLKEVLTEGAAIIKESPWQLLPWCFKVLDNSSSPDFAIEALRLIAAKIGIKGVGFNLVKRMAQQGMVDKALSIVKELNIGRYGSPIDTYLMIYQISGNEKALVLAKKTATNSSGATLLSIVGKELKDSKLLQAAAERAEKSDGEYDMIYVVRDMIDAGFPELASRAAESLRRPSQRAYCLADAAMGAKDEKEAERLFQLAISSATDIKHPFGVAQVTSSVIESMAKADLLESAETAANDIKMIEEQSKAFASIAVGYAKRGDWEKARQIMEERVKPSNVERYRTTISQAKNEMAILMAEQGYWDGAAGTARDIENNYYRREALMGVAVTAVKTRPNDDYFLDNALVLFKEASSLDRSEYSIYSKEEVVAAMVECGLVDEAVGYIHTIEGYSHEHASLISSELKAKVVDKLISRGDITRAEQMANEIAYESIRAESLVKVIKALIQQGDMDNAMRIAATSQFKHIGSRLEVLSAIK